MVRLGCSFGRKTPEVMYPSPCIPSGHMPSTSPITGDVDLGHLAEVILIRFLVSVLCCSEESYPLQPTCEGWESCSSSLGAEDLPKLIGSLRHRRLSLLSYAIYISVDE